jgi:hypothetical protein
MTEELSKTFVTPLEREDIEALSFALYRIPKHGREARRAPVDLPGAGAARQHASARS